MRSTSGKRVRRVSRALESLEQRLVFAAPTIGMNLDQVVDYSAAWTFTDAFKSSRDWFTLSFNTSTGSESWSGGGTPVLDAKGWPTELKSWTDGGQVIQQRLGTLMYREVGGNYPAGTYRAQWRGAGSLAFSFDARVIATGDNPDGSHWADLNVTPSSEGIYLKINSMPNPADTIRDIHVWLPDYNGQSFKGQVWQPGASFSPFHPLFLERLQPFKVLRFMDWMKTNTSTNQSWANRRAWDESNQTGDDGKGVALEYMIALANELNADVWFNMPYVADDNFVSNFATTVRDALEPELKVNVEWSNEIWNSAAGFNTYSWITSQLALPANSGLTRYQFAAREIKRDFDIWSGVFSAQPSGRLTRVVAGQASNATGVTEQILINMEGKYDAVSCTGYFGLNSAQRASFNASTTGDDVAKAVRGAVPSSINALKTHRTLGQQYAVPGKTIKIYAYEAGQHADGQGNANLSYLPALHAAQTSPLMYEAYDDFLRGFYDMGGDLAMHYTYVSRNDKNGSWGALQSQTQPTGAAPKYRALTEAVNGIGYFPEYSIAVTQAIGAEFGTVPVIFTVTRSGDKTLAQNVAFTLGGTASSNDYLNPAGGVIHFAAGQATALLTLTPVNDSSLEDTETVIVTLAPGSGYKLDGIATRITASASIVDDDGAVNFNLPIVNANFETGDLTGWTKIPTANNLIAVAPATPGGPVINAPPAPVQGSYWAWGAGNVGNIGGGVMVAAIAQTFSLSNHATGIDSGAARLNFSGWGAAWSNDWAQLEIRYLNAAGAQIGSTLTSNRALTDKTWTVMTADTAVPALTRSVELRATMNRTGGNASDAGVDALSAKLTYPIQTTVNVTATDAIASEPGTDKATFTVTRSGNFTLSQPLVVEYTTSGTATSGVDYTALPGTVTIPAGATSATITVSPIDDILHERNETVILTLVGHTEYVPGNSASATVTILDNDLPRVAISASDDTAAEAGQDPATFVVERLTEVLDQPLTVRYTLGGSAVNGSDYQMLSGVVVIPANESVAAVSLVPIDDTTVEHDESVVITLSSDPAYMVISPSSATATIVNDDHPTVTVVATDASASETGPDGATFTFTRTNEFLGEELTVLFTLGGTATPGVDYTLPAEGVTIPVGQLSASVTIMPVQDSLVEGTETVVVTLLPNGEYTPGSPSSATAYIADAVEVGASPPVWLAPGGAATWNATSKTLTVTGAATIIADPGADAPIIMANGAAAVLTLNPTTDRAIRLGGLQLSGGATATLASLGASRTAANHRVVIVPASFMAIDSASKLDLTDNDLIIDYDAAAPNAPAGFTAMVAAGYNGGNWRGARITSSTAASIESAGAYVLGISDNAKRNTPFSTFSGQTVDLTSVLVKFTHRSDVNMDGLVSFGDSVIFNGNYSEGVFATWSLGDLNLDGVYTFTDSVLFNGSYDESLPPL